MLFGREAEHRLMEVAVSGLHSVELCGYPGVGKRSIMRMYGMVEISEVDVNAYLGVRRVKGWTSGTVGSRDGGRLCGFAHRVAARDIFGCPESGSNELILGRIEETRAALDKNPFVYEKEMRACDDKSLALLKKAYDVLVLYCPLENGIYRMQAGDVVNVMRIAHTIRHTAKARKIDHTHIAEALVYVGFRKQDFEEAEP